MTTKTDKIKEAGPDKIKKASEKAEKEMSKSNDDIALSVCDALTVHPLSMARKLAIGRWVDAYPDADEQEIAMVSTYVLSLPKNDFWVKARTPAKLLRKASEFADDCDPQEYERLLQDTLVKIGHLQEVETMQGDADEQTESGNADRSPE
jgi:hypothetical protein